MRKMLLGTTALVAAGMLAAPAGAAEKMKVGIGGYMEQWVGFANNDGNNSPTEPVDPNSVATVTDAEVHFKGSTTLDNGISIGVHVELEGNTSGDQIDESYIRIKGGFGDVVVGSENSAMYLMHYGIQDFGIGLNSGDQPNWVRWAPGITTAGYWRQPLGSTNVEPLGTNDAEKISYFTPRVEGFQLGLSYGPDHEEAGGIQNRNTVNHDMFTAGLNFDHSFDAARIRVSGGWGTMSPRGDADGDDATAYNVGVRIGVAGFGVDAAYATFEDSGRLNGEGVSAAAHYTSGPWGVSLAWFNGERDGTVTPATTETARSVEFNRSHETIHLSAKYALGPGISANGTLGFTTVKTEDAVLPEDAEAEASYFVVGLKISF